MRKKSSKNNYAEMFGLLGQVRQKRALRIKANDTSLQQRLRIIQMIFQLSEEQVEDRSLAE